MRWVRRELSSVPGTQSVFSYISVAVGVVVTLCVCVMRFFLRSCCSVQFSPVQSLSRVLLLATFK